MSHINTESDIWNEILSFYKEKKETYIKNTPPNPKGDRYGFTLDDPLSLDDVEVFERRMGIQLPKDFKTYITKVSSEIFVSSYPLVISLWLEDEELPKPCLIPKDTEMIYEGNVCGHADDNWKDCTDDCPTIWDGMMSIGDGGCSFSDYIVVDKNSSHYGEVWWSTGDYVSKQKDSFMEYITYNMPQAKKERDDKHNKWKKENPKEALTSFALAYNFLRIDSGLPSLKYSK